MITRLLADGVRFLLTAIVIQYILDIPIEYCILIIGIVTLVYSIFGGVKTIIQALQKIQSEGRTKLIMVAGSDRVEEFSKLLNQYKEKK